MVTIGTAYADPSKQRLPGETHTDRPQSDFWVLADSQLHNATGAVTRSTSGVVDRFISKTAIRPPSLDLWSDVVLEKAVGLTQMGEPFTPTFFLGDAANISCIDEYARFLKIMRGHPSWFGVLGNHDGFYMGNLMYAPNAVAGDYTWQGACSTDGGEKHARWMNLEPLINFERAFWKTPPGESTYTEQGVLTKPQAVWMYLAQLRERGVIGDDPFVEQNWKPASNRWRVFRSGGLYRTPGGPRSVAVVAYVDDAMHSSRQGVQGWRAFLLQDVELSDGSHAILIDSSDYINDPPRLGLGGAITGLGNLISKCRDQTNDRSLPGNCGEFGSEQAAELAAMLNARISPGGTYSFLGHHSWSELRKDSAVRLRNVIRKHPGFVTYVSGHTHYPTATTSTDVTFHWEVNVASTTDWPMELARISYWNLPAKKSVDLRVEVRGMAGDVRTGGRVCPYARGAESTIRSQVDREMDYGENELYVNRALDVYDRILDAIPGVLPACSQNSNCTAQLTTFRRLISGSRSDAISAKRVLLHELMMFDRTVLRQSLEMRELELDCAVWASELEDAKNTKGGRKQRLQRNGRRLNPKLPEVYRIRLPIWP